MQTTDTGEHFHPHVAWVEPGGTVTFVNESGTHTATAYHPDNDKPQRIPDGAASFDSGLLTEEGATWEHTFETEGVYDIYCAPHEQLGMIGTVLVGEPDPHDQPGLAEPQSEMSDAVATKIQSLNSQVNTMLGHDH
ncbi:MAG: plastocyanin/azurin family copper-binding protein [Halobacteriales archaeon]|nr:plastocyanin/azurin family copper-binding protein [Halobacteriales archaeon]